MAMKPALLDIREMQIKTIIPLHTYKEGYNKKKNIQVLGYHFIDRY